MRRMKFVVRAGKTLIVCGPARVRRVRTDRSAMLDREREREKERVEKRKGVGYRARDD